MYSYQSNNNEMCNSLVRQMMTLSKHHLPRIVKLVIVKVATSFQTNIVKGKMLNIKHKS